MSARAISASTREKAPQLTSEHTEQCLLFQWAGYAANQNPELKLLFAVPNFARISPQWGAWMKAEGKRAGVPDVILPIARGGYHSLYIELKVGKNKPSPEQMGWISALNAYGNQVCVCYDWEAAKDVILEYLALR